MGIGAPFLRAFHDKFIYSLVEKQTLPPRLDLFLSFFLLCPLTDSLSVLRLARIEPPPTPVLSTGLGSQALPQSNILCIEHIESPSALIPRAPSRSRYERPHHLCKVTRTLFIGAHLLYYICSFSPSRGACSNGLVPCLKGGTREGEGGVWTGEGEHRRSGTTRDRAKGWQGIGGRSQPLLCRVVRAYTRSFVSLRRERDLSPGLGGRKSRRMISLAHSCLWIFGGIISYPREPSPITKDPRHYPQETGIQASPTKDILRAR